MRSLTLFLCGDVMTGRGIDQILSHPSDPQLHESYVKNARDYVALAEATNGPIPREVGASYIWGDALGELARVRPHARIINLETAITSSDNWERKGINYRMHPRNRSCLSAAGIDCCVLANNHVLDWGPQGLIDTLVNLREIGIGAVGAGRTLREAQEPVVLSTSTGRVIVFAFGSETSGIPPNWAATKDRPGVNLLPDLMADLLDDTVERIGREIRLIKKPGDIVVVSLHWGDNWGFEIPKTHRRFAHDLIDGGLVDLIHGHSSHHVKGLEIYRGKLIIYGCGDFISDYEGISGYEEFRGDLALMYFPQISVEDGTLLGLELVPLRMNRFRLEHAAPADVEWLRQVLHRERDLGICVAGLVSRGQSPDGIKRSSS